MEKHHLRQILISILIGTTVAFLQLVLAELTDFIKANASEIISGVVGGMTYFIKQIKDRA